MKLGPHTITRLRGVPALDPYSNENDELDWDSPTETAVTGCSVQPGPPQPQDLAQRDSVTILFTVWAPLAADITEKDRVRYAGEVYAVDSTIQRWNFPQLGHLVIPLKKVEG